MKIAFIGQKGMPASYGGVERHVEELATRLSKMGHEVSVYCRPWYVRMAQSSELRAQSHKGVNLIFLPSLKTKHLDTLSHTFLASWHALFQKYDIIHYQSIGPSALIFFFRLFKGKTKIFSTLHCPDYEHQKWGKISQFLLRLGESIAVNFSDQTITVSKTYQNYLRRRYGKNPILIPNGVNPPQVKKANLITKKWGLTKKSYLLVVSRLIRHKGIHTVISAYQKLKNSRLNRRIGLFFCGIRSQVTKQNYRKNEVAGGGPRLKRAAPSMLGLEIKRITKSFLKLVFSLVSIYIPL